MKKVLLTIREYTNQQNEKKKARVNVGRIHKYQDGGESIILDAALCATIGAMGQKALNNGEDSVWLSIFEEQSKGDNSYNRSSEYNQQPPQQAPQMQQPPQHQYNQAPPSPVNQNGFQN